MQNRFFDLHPEPQEKTEEKRNPPFKNKYLLSHFQKVENLERDLKRLPEQEEFFFMYSEKQFNAFTFVLYILKTQVISHLYASTYSVSIRVIESLMELHDSGMVERITLLVSDSLIKRNPVTIDKMEALASSRANVKIQYSWNHSKVTLARTFKDHYVIEGSGNWSENAAIEQYIFANSKDLYDFRKQIFE